MNLVIDAGGTNLRAKLHNGKDIIDSIYGKSKDIGVAKFAEDIVLKHKNIKTIGISYAGQVKDGYIIDSPNIKVDIPNIKEYFQTKFNIPLFIENDLTCAVIAEANDLKSKNICALYVGTGLGLGVMEDGKVLKGSTNMATEIGHIPYKKTSLVCGCGRDNCIELFASGSGIKKWIEHFGLTCKPTLEALKNDLNPNSHKILADFETALLYGVGTAITLFNPEILVLGGGIIDANPYLVDIITSNAHLYTLSPTLKNCKIIKSKLKDAPLKGALLLKDIK